MVHTPACEIRIGCRQIGPGHSTFFIADIAANHDGDLVIIQTDYAKADECAMADDDARFIVASRNAFKDLVTKAYNADGALGMLKSILDTIEAQAEHDEKRQKFSAIFTMEFFDFIFFLIKFLKLLEAFFFLTKYGLREGFFFKTILS